MPAINLAELKCIVDSVDEADRKDTPIIFEHGEYESEAVEAVLKNVSADKSKEELVLVIR